MCGSDLYIEELERGSEGGEPEENREESYLIPINRLPITVRTALQVAGPTNGFTYSEDHKTGSVRLTVWDAEWAALPDWLNIERIGARVSKGI